jgi:hypothetical protein
MLTEQTEWYRKQSYITKPKISSQSLHKPTGGPQPKAVLQDMKFSQRYLWRFRPSGMWSCINGWLVMTFRKITLSTLFLKDVRNHSHNRHSFTPQKTQNITSVLLIPPPLLFLIHFNTTLPSMPRTQKGHFPHDPWTKLSFAISCLPPYMLNLPSNISSWLILWQTM